MSDKDMRSLGQQWGERWPRLGKQQEMWAVQGSELRQAGNKCLLLLHPQGVHVSLVPKQDPGRVFLQASHLWGHGRRGIFLNAVADTAGLPTQYPSPTSSFPLVATLMLLGMIMCPI